MLKSSAQKISLTLLLIATTYIMLWYSWIQDHELVVSLVILGVAVWAVGFVQGGAPQQADPGSAAPSDPLEKRPLPALAGFLLGLAGLACAWLAYKAVLSEKWLQAASLIGAGALAWRLGLPPRLPTLSRGATAVLLSLALLCGGAFRFTKIGDIPVGLCGLDESALKIEVTAILNGDRPTVHMLPGVMGDGTVPHYLESLGLRWYGNSIKGYRISGAVIGTLLVLVIFLVAGEGGGAWMGLAAAFLWSMCLWPVAISRAHYLLIETHLIVLLCLFFTLRGLKKDSPFSFALAGLFWAFTFQVYHAAQVMLALVPWLFFLVWYLNSAKREVLARGLLPMVGGLLLGMGPFLLWAATNRHDAFLTVFGILYAGHTAGSMSASTGVLKAMDLLLGRALPCFPLTMQMLTTHGPFHGYFFPSLLESNPSYPIVNPAVMFLFLVGTSVSLARFRNPWYSFLLFWWAASLLPGLVSDPGAQPDDRRSTMLMPPLLIIASLGLVTSLDFLARAFQGRVKQALFLLAGLGFFGALAQVSWHDYFERNARDSGFLNAYEGESNLVEQSRYIEKELAKGPCVVVSTQRLNTDSWDGPNDEPYNTVYQALVTAPILYTQEHVDYYEREGLFSSLRWAAGQVLPDPSGGASAPVKPDILVALTPFHFYLEPLLKRLGGKTVQEVPVVQTDKGPVLKLMGMAPPVNGLSMKLVRLHGLDGQAIDAVRDASLFNFRGEELTPPTETRGAVTADSVFAPSTQLRLSQYESHALSWRTQRRVDFRLPDPFFWTTVGNLPGSLFPPMRIRVSFDVQIDTPGAYAFGASATPYTVLKLDGKQVFKFQPNNSGIYPMARMGILGQELPLKAGVHRLEAEQVLMTYNGNFNHVFRLVWKKPGGEMETLSLDNLKPVPLR